MLGLGKINIFKITQQSVLTNIKITQGIGRFNAKNISGVGFGTTEFTALQGEGAGTTTESNVQIPIGNSIRITRVRIKADANSLDGDLIVGFRTAGSTVAFATILAGVTTLVDGGAIAIIVPANTLCNMIYSAAGTVGTASFISIEVEYDGAV